VSLLLPARSGCGNTVNANGPAGKQLILDSLRHWYAQTHSHTHAMPSAHH
jgi:hypothetical protein